MLVEVPRFLGMRSALGKKTGGTLFMIGPSFSWASLAWRFGAAERYFDQELCPALLSFDSYSSIFMENARKPELSLGFEFWRRP